MSRTTSQARSVITRSVLRHSTTDRTLSAVAFALVLGSWCAAYTIVCPAEAPRAHHAQLVAVAP